ncbi:hypothetical protein B7463_g3512, partial [Scytalidium lignicola]
MDGESWSQARIDAVLQTIKPKLVIMSTQTDFGTGVLPVIKTEDIRNVYNTSESRVDSGLVMEKIDRILNAEEPLYIIFTSGTTGAPKGVVIPRRCVENYVRQGNDQGMPFNMGVSSEDKVLLLFSLAFDAAWGAIFSTLYNGGELILTEPGKVLDDAQKCTILPTTPSVLGSLGDPERYQTIKSIFIGGESPNPGLVQKWCSIDRRVFNCYGPTEATVCRFVSWHGRRLYRTLDRARRTVDGLVFCGREDSMVKNRGYLVNLDMDVLPILLSYPGIHSAAAFMYKGKLVATITPEHVDVMELRRQLSQKYDRFAVPDEIVAYAELPQTSNGKVDIKRLKDTFKDQYEYLGTGTVEGTHRAILQEAVAEVLAFPKGAVSMDQSFWDLGGHSLLAVKLLSSLYQRGKSLHFQEIFEPIPLSALSERLERVWVPDSGIRKIQKNEIQDDFEITAPMTMTQIGMIHSSIRQPVTNYMLVSIVFPWNSETGYNQQVQNAWKAVLERHTIFRTSFDLMSGVQKICQDYHHNWAEIWVSDTELSMTIKYESDRLLKSTRQDENTNVFRPHSKFRLIICQGGTKASLLWLVHHSLIDGWSMGNIIEEVQTLLRGGKLTQNPLQFWQFSQQLPQYCNQTVTEGRKFWRDTLSQVADAPPLSLIKPTDMATDNGFGDAEVDVRLSLSQIEQICSLNKATSAAVLHAAWALLLHSYTSQEQLVFGTVFSGRNFPLPGINEIVGPILNTCPFPISLANLKIKVEVLAHVQRLIRQISSHQWSAADALQDIMPGSQSRVFQTILFLEYDLPGFDSSGWQFDRTDNPEFGLTVLIRRKKDHLKFRALFDRTIYTKPVIQRMMVHFRNLFLAFLDTKCQTIAEVRQRMLEPCEFLSLTTNSPTLMSPYVGPTNLKDSFEIGVDQWPNTVAIESLTRSITYQELDQLGNYVAGVIAGCVRPGEAVAILSDRSIDWLISVFAVIKAGAAYVPLDTKLPVDRMRIMMETAKVRLCIFPNEDCHGRFRDIFHSTISLHQILAESTDQENLRLGTITRPEDTAYITFTSGSTGIPKGVCIQHQSVVSYLSYGPARMDARPGRRHAQMFSPGFDVNQAEIFGTLCYGATLVLADPADPFTQLPRVHATMITPSFLSVCDPDDFPNLDTILFAGEAVPQVLADRWAGTRTVYNSYGPCECTIGCLFQPLQPQKEVTLGRTIPRVGVYLLDPQNHPVPIGVPGEICLSGIQIANGYIGPDLEQLTQARFGPDPFVPGYRIYRTGDRAVWTEDMEPRFLGRFDHQVKVRGFRVELNEIENVICMASPEVRRAAAIVSGDIIIAFVEPETIDISVIQVALRNKLPEYACPSTIMALPSLPTMPNQKLDRKKLQSYAPSVEEQRPGSSLTSLQCLLAEAWKETLGLSELVKITAESDFLVLGGSSISQIRLAQIVCRKMNTKLPLKLFIWNTKLSVLSDLIAKHLLKEELSQEYSFKLSWKMIQPPYTAVTHLEEELVKLSISSPSPQAFNVASKVRLNGNVNITALEKAIATVISHEVILQSCFRIIDDQVIRFQSCNPCEVTRNKQSNIDTSSFANRPFDLSVGPLTRILLDQNLDHVDIVLVQHHAITDKVAIKMFFFKIQHEYLQILEARSPDAEKSTFLKPNYAIWAKWKSDQLPPPMQDSNCQYWRDHLASLPNLPFESIQNQRSYVGSFDNFSLKRNKRLTESMETYVSLIALALAEVQGICDVTIGIPHIDRSEPGTEDFLGVFLDRLPVRIKISSTALDNFSDLIGSVRTLIRDALAHSIPFKQIRSISGKDELFQVMVVYNRIEDSVAKGFALPGITVEDVPVRTTGAKFPLLVEFNEEEECMTCEIEYMESLVDPTTVSAIGETIRRLWSLL